MTRENSQEKRVFLVYLFLGIYLFFIMLLCAGTSPIIDSMDIDSSVFFMVGRGMAKGKIPYLEMFDHKGWYIYFINFLGALISSSNSLGIFLIEYLFIYLSTILVYKTFLELHPEKGKVSIGGVIASLVTTILFFYRNTYQGGNLVEEYCISLQLLSSYFLILYIKKSAYQHPPQYMLVHGICVGIAFFLRANMIFMWGAIAGVILIDLLVKKKYYFFFLNIFWGLAGIIISCFPPILYAIITNSLSDMIEQSILFNIAYSGSNTGMLKNVFTLFNDPLVLRLIVMCFVSSIVTLKSKEINNTFKWIYCVGLLLSVFSVSISGRNYGHYFEYLIVFLIPLVFFLIHIFEKMIYNRSILIKFIAVFCAFIITLCANRLFPSKLYRAFSGRASYTQDVNTISAIFREHVNANDVVLVVGNNCVFYNKTGSFPKTKYFYTPSVSYSLFPYAVDNQAQSVLSGENDVVIVNKERTLGQKNLDSNIIDYLLIYYDLQYEINGVQMWTKRIERNY